MEQLLGAEAHQLRKDSGGNNYLMPSSKKLVDHIDGARESSLLQVEIGLLHDFQKQLAGLLGEIAKVIVGDLVEGDITPPPSSLLHGHTQAVEQDVVDVQSDDLGSSLFPSKFSFRVLVLQSLFGV